MTCHPKINPSILNLPPPPPLPPSPFLIFTLFLIQEMGDYALIKNLLHWNTSCSQKVKGLRRKARGPRVLQKQRNKKSNKLSNSSLLFYLVWPQWLFWVGAGEDQILRKSVSNGSKPIFSPQEWLTNWKFSIRPMWGSMSNQAVPGRANSHFPL